MFWALSMRLKNDPIVMKIKVRMFYELYMDLVVAVTFQKSKTKLAVRQRRDALFNDGIKKRRFILFTYNKTRNYYLALYYFLWVMFYFTYRANICYLIQVGEKPWCVRKTMVRLFYNATVHFEGKCFFND